MARLLRAAANTAGSIIPFSGGLVDAFNQLQDTVHERELFHLYKLEREYRALRRQSKHGFLSPRWDVTLELSDLICGTSSTAFRSMCDGLMADYAILTDEIWSLQTASRDDEIFVLDTGPTTLGADRWLELNAFMLSATYEDERLLRKTTQVLVLDGDAAAHPGVRQVLEFFAQSGARVGVVTDASLALDDFSLFGEAALVGYGVRDWSTTMLVPKSKGLTDHLMA